MAVSTMVGTAKKKTMQFNIFVLAEAQKINL